MKATILNFRKIKKLLYIVFISVVFFACSSTTKTGPVFNEVLQFSGDQLELLTKNTEQLLTEGNGVDQRGRKLVVPRSLHADGSLYLIPSRDWVSGFFPGTLWFMYQYTGLPKWKTAAEKFTAPLEPEKLNKGTHDLGFMMGCSFGKGYELTGNPVYREILIESANSLISRYHPTVGAIRSWDFNRETWQFPVIIDNMMNLELLFWASKETGDPIYSDIAIQHARTSMAAHYRDDISTYHVIDFDTITGDIRHRHTHQGLHHESAWARGQAWGLYGYVMSHRETGITEFLELAEKIADYWLNHPNLPKDLVPYWDFDVEPGSDEPRDVSAACITASALFELASFLPHKKKLYEDKASQMLKNIFDNYRSKPGANYGFILESSTGHKPANSEVDVPIIYAEYYFLEALGRYNSIR